MHYLDHAASSPLRPEARIAWLEANERVGNGSSVHSAGQHARATLENSRAALAQTIGVDPVEIIFTGSGTEAVNLALKGIFALRNSSARRDVIIVPEGEHHATLDTVEWLAAKHGAVLEWIGLDRRGCYDLTQLERSLAKYGDRVALMTALWANNEVGTVEPVSALVDLADAYRVPLHLDAIAAFGHENIDVGELTRQSSPAADRPGEGLVALSISAHKIGGPQGIGALYLARQASLDPLVHGGGQQRRLHSGTEPVALAAAFAAAATVAVDQRAAENQRLRALRATLEHAVAELDGVRINGSPTDRLAHNLHITVTGAESDSLLFLLDQAGIAVSTGSACQAGVTEVSHVVRALGFSESESRGSLRFTLGWSTTAEDVAALVAALPGAIRAARAAGLATRSTRFDG